MVDGVEPRSGATLGGMPLSLNRAPASDLDPWIGRVVVTRVHTAPDYELSCSVFNDLAFQRVVLGGDWVAQTSGGEVRIRQAPVLMGPQSRRMEMTCRGGFATVNIGFRPGALGCLLGGSIAPLVDRVERRDPFGLAGESGADDERGGGDFGYPQDCDVEELALIVEERMRAFIARTKPKRPDPISTAFEAASFVDPNLSPSQFAGEHDISLRQVERIVRRDFGMTPRTVLRRARAMDLACHLLGLSAHAEEQEFLLRFFDQSHLIREFQHFFGVTPHQLRAQPRILLTLNLESRAARRLEELERIAPGDRRPWHEMVEEEDEEAEDTEDADNPGEDGNLGEDEDEEEEEEEEEEQEEEAQAARRLSAAAHEAPHQPSARRSPLQCAKASRWWSAT